MDEDKIGNLEKLPINSIVEDVDAEPRIDCSEKEIIEVLHDLSVAVDAQDYVPQTATRDNPALSDDYIFNTNDENLVLKDLTKENFVGKVKDLSRGAAKRKSRGLPQEYLYVFKYPCKLLRRDELESGPVSENVLIYIKINDRKTPYKKVFVVSFHKNRAKKD